MRRTFALAVSLSILLAATFVAAPVVAAAPARAAQAADQPLRIGGNVKPPERVKYVAPVYPAVAAAAKVSGVVVIEAVIGPDGSVTEAKVLRSIALLDQAALTAVKQWKYTPTTLNGKPVPVIMTVTVSFTPPNVAVGGGKAGDEGAPKTDSPIDDAPVNIKLTITVTDKGAGPAQTKVATVTMANKANSALRSAGNRGSAVLNADARASLLKNGLVSLFLSVNYLPMADTETPSFEVTQRSEFLMKDGVPMVIAQAADPTKNGRSVTIEVTATILK